MAIEDLNAAYPLIAERLGKIAGVKKVCGVNDLTQVLNGKNTGTNAFIYLIFNGVQPKSESNKGRFQRLTVSYKIIVASQTYDRNGMPENIGFLIAGIIQALSAFSPLDNDERSKNIMRFMGSETAAHSYGLSLYPLVFELDIDLIAN